MAITGISVVTNRTHYSRHEPERAKVLVTINAKGTPAGEAFQFSIYRKAISGNFVIYTLAGIINAAQTFITVDLRTLVDADGFPQAHFSYDYQDYSAAVVVTSPALQAQADFSVVLFTIETIKTRWLNGLPLISMEKTQVRLQPQVVTGVQLSDPSYGTRPSTASLVFTTGSPPTLTWAGGTPIPIAPGQTEFVLPDASGHTILAIIADPTQLPVASVSENLYLDLGVMSDEAILREIIGMTAEIENAMHIYLEPTVIVTREFLQMEPQQSLPTQYDKVVEAQTFYKPDNWMKWLDLKLPHTPVRKIYKLAGYFNQSKAVDIDKGLITFDDRSGVVQLVPSNLAVINSFFVGPGVYVLFFNQLFVPQFWNYWLLAGFSVTPTPIIEYIGKRVAMNLLIQAGQARYAAGIAGYSIARDGVSESRSLVPGVYMAQVQAYERQFGRTPDGRDNQLISLKNRYGPILFTTL